MISRIGPLSPWERAGVRACLVVYLSPHETERDYALTLALSQRERGPALTLSQRERGPVLQ